MKRNLKDLRNDSIDTKPQDFDFSAGFGETWEFFEPVECEKCGEVLLSTGGQDRHNDMDPDSKCTGYMDNADGPTMNYFYPLHSASYDRMSSEDALKLAGLPLCLVYFEETETWGLALTGGGMDLSWEICEGFMRLGFLPPAHFAGGLPAMAGMKLNARNRWILSGCRKSLQLRAQWAKSDLRRLANLRGQLATN